MKNTLEKVGKWSFIAGLIIVILLTIVPGIMENSWWPIILIILGIIVGLLNIQAKEVTQFLVATIALMLSTSILGGISLYLQNFAISLAAFAAAAAVIVAIKAIITLGKK
jgi:membrane-bound ClpP family serine protease